MNIRTEGITMTAHNKKAILLGDYTKTPYHPLDAIEQELVDILSVEDEPYQYEFDPFTEKTILFEYSYENQRSARIKRDHFCVGL
jgi:hypothetical protein